MPLTATCKDCQQAYTFPALQKSKQTGRCTSCQLNHDIHLMENQIDVLQTRINTTYPQLCKLNTAKQLAKQAYEEAFDKWEDLARVHTALDHKMNTLMHKRDILTQKKVVAKTKKAPVSPADRAKKALASLPADVRAAILAQLQEVNDDQD